MNKKDLHHLLDWVKKAKRDMEVSGAFNIVMHVPAMAYKDLQAVYGSNDVAHYLYNGSNRVVTLMGLEVYPHTHSQNDRTVQLIAQGMNLTSANIKPITKQSVGWPVRPHANLYRDIMKKVKDWCVQKNSAFFQKRDLMRIAECSANMAYETLRYYAEVGDIERCDHHWWYWPSMHNPLKEPRPRREPAKNRFLQDYRAIQQLVGTGAVSKQQALYTLGIDYAEEAKRMQIEKQYMDNLSMSSGPLMGLSNIPKGAK